MQVQTTGSSLRFCTVILNSVPKVSVFWAAKVPPLSLETPIFPGGGHVGDRQGGGGLFRQETEHQVSLRLLRYSPCASTVNWAALWFIGGPERPGGPTIWSRWTSNFKILDRIWDYPTVQWVSPELNEHHQLISVSPRFQKCFKGSRVWTDTSTLPYNNDQLPKWLIATQAVRCWNDLGD